MWSSDLGIQGPKPGLRHPGSRRWLHRMAHVSLNGPSASWGKIFDDPMVAAMLDRLLHRSVVVNIDGDSYRMRTHRARSEKLRKGVVGTQNA